MRRFPALLLALASTQIFAQEVRGPYIGLGVDQIGYSNTVHRIDFDESALSTKITGGFRFNDTLAFEAAYGQSDEFVANVSGNMIPFTSPVGPIGGDVTASFTGTFDVMEARVLAHQNHILIGLGFFSADTELSVTGTSSGYGPFADSSQGSESGYSVILGLQWDVGDFGIRGEYTYYDLDDDAGADSFGVGFHYRF